MKNAATSSVNQKLHFVGREAGKLLALRQALADGGLKPPVLVFVGSKERAKALHRCAAGRGAAWRDEAGRGAERRSWLGGARGAAWRAGGGDGGSEVDA